MNTDKTTTTISTPELQWEKPVLLKEDWMNTLTGIHLGTESTFSPDPAAS